MELSSELTKSPAQFSAVVQGLSENMQTCVVNCSYCHQVCERMVQHCLMKGGVYAESSHIRLLQDCAQICMVSADFMLRESELHHQICHMCAGVCLRCAHDCERMNDDEMTKLCIEACQNCVSSCSVMATQSMQ